MMVCFIAVVMALFVATLPLGIWRLFAERNAVADAVIIAVCLLVSALFVRKVVRRDIETGTWRLDDEALVGGVRGACRIQLADIVSISQGVPVRPRHETFWHRGALVVKLRGGRLLMLNLLHTEGGRELMEALVVRCESVFTISPVHTQKELVLLQRPRWNRLLGPDIVD